MKALGSSGMASPLWGEESKTGQIQERVLSARQMRTACWKVQWVRPYRTFHQLHVGEGAIVLGKILPCLLPDERKLLPQEELGP